MKKLHTFRNILRNFFHLNFFFEIHNFLLVKFHATFFPTIFLMILNICRFSCPFFILNICSFSCPFYSEYLQVFLSILKIYGQCRGGSLWLSGKIPKPLFCDSKAFSIFFYIICKFWSSWGGMVGTAYPSVGQAHPNK